MRRAYPQSRLMTTAPLLRAAAAGGEAGDVEPLAPLLADPVVGEELVHLVALLRPLGALAHHHQAAAVVAACAQGHQAQGVLNPLTHHKQAAAVVTASSRTS